MPQIKISINEEILDFVSNYKNYGYSSKSEIVANALIILKEKLEIEALAESSKLYQEIYESDNDLQELTDSAVSLCLE